MTETNTAAAPEGGVIAPDAGGDQALLKLAAARVIACDRMPYLSTAIFAMVPVKVEGLGTFASDAKWRLYWDPAKVAEWDVQALAGVLLHEVGHCLRGHADRFRAMNEPMQRHMVYNIAGDSLINVDLRDLHIPLPDGAVYVESLPGATREMSAEQIYRILIEEAEKHCTCGKGDSQQSEQDGSQQGGGKGDSQQSEQDGSQQGGGKGTDPNCPLHGEPNYGWDCGSAADGVKRDYEVDDAAAASVDEDRADLIRQRVAVEIKEHSKNRGNVPGGWDRWAKDLLDPVVDWRRELSSIIRRTFASVAGLKDYTYRRPSRRQSAMRGTGQGVILPAMRQPAPPQVAIVIDTSGSMSDEMLTWALSETQGVLRSIGAGDRSVAVYACDAQTASPQRVRDARKIVLTGGGGTDMRVGIDAAMSASPKPDAVIVISDGYTPWPSEPLKGGATLIVALTDEGAADSVPDFARRVVVTPT